MVALSFALSQLWLIFLIALVVAFVIFPLVFVMSLLYDYLAEKYEKTPKVLIMLFVTFVAAFIAILLIEIYLEFTLPLALAPV